MPDLGDSGVLSVSPEVGGTRVQTQAPIEAFGGGAAREQGAEAGAGVGMAMSSMAGLHDYDANQLAQQDALNKAMSGYNGLLYGSFNQDGSVASKGLHQYNGKDSLAAETELEPQLKEHLDHISEQFTDPRQKVQFQRHAVDLMDRFHGEVLSHVDKQVSVYSKQSTQEAVQQAQVDAANNWQKAFQKGQPLLDDEGKPLLGPDGQPMTQPNPVEAATHNIVMALQEEARRQGQDPNGPEVKTQMLLEVGKLHAAVLTEMANAGDDQGASRYFNEHKGEIPLKAREGLEKVITAAETVGGARRKTAEILNNPATANDYNKQLEVAGDIENDGIRRKVMADLKQNHFVDERAKADEQTGIYTQAREKFLKAGAQGPVEDPSIVSVSDFAKLTNTQQNQLRKLEQPPVSDRKHSLRARRNFLNLGPEGIKSLAQPDFDKYWLKMNGPDRTYTQEIYNAAQQNQPAKVNEAVSHGAAADSLIANTGTKDPDTAAMLHDQLHQSLANYQTTHKAPADPAQVQTISDQVAKDHLLNKKAPGAGIDTWLKSNNLKSGADLWNMSIGDKKAQVDKIAPAGTSPEMKGRFLAKMLMEEDSQLK